MVVEIHLDDRLGETRPDQFSQADGDGLALLEVAAMYLPWLRATQEGRGSFDAVINAVATVVTTENPWGRPAYVYQTDTTSDTPLRRRLGYFIPRQDAYTRTAGDLEAVTINEGGELVVGALLTLLDVATFRGLVMNARRGTATVIVPTAAGSAEDALERLIAPPRVGHDVRDAPEAAKRIKHAGCCVLRLWLDDRESSVEVFGPPDAVGELVDVLRPMIRAINA